MCCANPAKLTLICWDQNAIYLILIIVIFKIFKVISFSAGITANTVVSSLVERFWNAFFDKHALASIGIGHLAEIF